MVFDNSWILIAFVVGVIIGLIGVFIMKSQLKSVRFQAAAHHYEKKDTFVLTEQRDVYLYSTVTKIPKPKNNSKK